MRLSNDLHCGAMALRRTIACQRFRKRLTVDID
jgi:hypothetical protein